MAKKKKAEPEEATQAESTGTATEETAGAEDSQAETNATNGGHLTPEELAAAIAEEKARLERKLCDQRNRLNAANYEWNKSSAETKELKKAAEVVQAAVNETVNRLSDVLEGNWAPPRPDPQKELPFNDGEISGALWRSEPVESLGLSKSLTGKLGNEFTSLGVLSDELEKPEPFEGLDFGPGQISKIRAAVEKFIAEKCSNAIEQVEDISDADHEGDETPEE